MTAPGDMLLAVLGVQLGYLSADDVLGSARELAQPGEKRTLAQFLVERGMLDRARAQVLERLAARACTTAGGDAAQTLELLPAEVRQLTAQSGGRADAQPVQPRADVVDEQPHRYFAAPRADAPPRELGRGAFGRVVSMHDTVLGRDVAWKQAYAASPESDAALMEQARLLARLDHPSVVPIYELGRDAKGAVYATLRQVTGDTLAEALTRASGLEERLALLPAVHSIARCVAMAHEVGVTHRRLSCNSISLGRFGEVYLLGWGPPEPEGLAESAEGAPFIPSGVEGRGRGGPSTSPGVNGSAAPNNPLGVSGDVKALGAILHEVVTGLPAPVMGTVQVRGAPDDLLGLCRSALGGSLGTAEQFANELKAYIDGRRLGSYRYSSWQLLKRYVRQHRLFSLMALTASILVLAGVLTAASRVREERDRARLFARRFLDDVALRLRPQPGVEPLLEQVTTAALRHYQRTTDLQSAPREERLRVARAMARLGVVSLSLSRLDEARHSLDFGDVLAQGLADESATDGQARVVLAQTAVARAGMPGLDAAQSLRWAERGRELADQALSLMPDSLEARRAAASARIESALRESEPALAQRDFDEAVQLLELPAKEPTEELARRQALGAALVERTGWRAKDARGEYAAEAQQVVARLASLRERTPDDLELQLDAARAELLLAEALEVADAGKSQAHASNAAALAREVVSRRPDRLEVAVLLVKATLRAGHAKEALAAARGFAARGVKPVEPLVAEAALFAGDFEAARTAAGQEQSPQLVLIRALAGAWLERPSDAVIQARAMKATVVGVGWPAARLARALEGVPPGPGLGEVAVRRFAQQWNEVGVDAALGEFIGTLEAQLQK
ncbi:MAG: protein kinase [Archangium sp.]|nr:protein kinase [Archangium sp.]